MGKPVLQPHRNQSVVRQPTAFKFERPRISKPRFASQVDVNNDLSKPVTTHYLPKKRESAVVNPHYVIASNKSRNSSKNMPRFSSNDMVHNHYLDEARKKTQANGRNSEPSVMPSSRSQRTANDCKPKPRSNTQTSRNWHASKNSCVTTKTVPIAEQSRISRNFFDSKHFVCSTCQKCVVNVNHDHCVTKFLNKVNSRAKVPFNKTMNRNKLVEQISIAKKPDRQIPKGHSSKLVPKVVPPADKTATSQQELELLFSPMYKEYFNAGNPSVSKSSALSDNLQQHDTQPTTNIPPTSKTINPPTNFNAEENMTFCYEKQASMVVLHETEFIQRWRWRHLIPAESDSLPHAHAQSTKTYYKHQDPRIKKAQELKTKTSANSDIKDNSSETKLRGRLLESFQKDAKYEHVGQDIRSQGGKDNQDKQRKRFRDLEIKDEVKRQLQRLKIKDHTAEGTSL
ncbi:hypothetical protein Tco_1042715 [Tanacetum coccineum]|uniref:Uncharacterized protein n=1 Tax=Tanacetum coccineum TaxID=301880 RepID=A0ABQ5GL83_9ASTR